MKYIGTIICLFLSTSLVAQKNLVELKSTNYLAYKFTTNLKPNKFNNYDTLKSNMILFTNQKINPKMHTGFLRLKQALENQTILTNIVVYNVYWDAAEVVKSETCTQAPNLFFNNRIWTPNPFDIENVKSLKEGDQMFVYIDTCSGDFRSNKSLIAPYLQYPNSSNKQKNQIIRVFRTDFFLDMLDIFGQLTDRINQLNDTLTQAQHLLENEINELKSNSAQSKSFSLGMLGQISFFAGPKNRITDLKYNLTNYNSKSIGGIANFYYNLKKKSIYDDFQNAANTVVFGFTYLNNIRSFNLNNNDINTHLLATNIIDASGDIYNRYLTINNISEFVSIQAHRFLIDLDFQRIYDYDNYSIGWLAGFTAGSDFGSKINYQLKHSEAFYSGKYPQYNINDTIFNNIDDFGKLVALNPQESSFRNSGSSILLGGNLGVVINYKKVLFTLKGSFCRTNSSFNANGTESALPLFSNMPYNSVLLRTNYLNYNTIAFNIGLNYFL